MKKTTQILILATTAAFVCFTLHLDKMRQRQREADMAALHTLVMQNAFMEGVNCGLDSVCKKLEGRYTNNAQWSDQINLKCEAYANTH